MNDATHTIGSGVDVFTATPAEVRRAGLDAVARALGPVGLARFLQFYKGGQGDYTAERDALVGTPRVAERFDVLAPASAASDG